MLQQFNFQDHTVRVVLDDDNQPMFVAKDIATILGYADTNKAINTHCGGVVILRTISDSLGRSQEMRVIYEPDLYRLIFGSKLPSAQQFQNSELLTFNNELTMSSREIATLCSKQHKHVLRDIDTLNETYEQMAMSKIGQGYYSHKNTGSQQHREYHLTKEQTIDLVISYPTELLIKVNRRWQELEQGKTKLLPQTKLAKKRL